MSASKKSTEDTWVDPDDAPELADEWFKKADLYDGEKLIRRGRRPLDNPKQANSTLGFGYDPKVDPILDGQTREVTRGFLRSFLDDMRVPGSRGANVTTDIPRDLSFQEQVTVRGPAFRLDDTAACLLNTRHCVFSSPRPESLGATHPYLILQTDTIAPMVTYKGYRNCYHYLNVYWGRPNAVEARE